MIIHNKTMKRIFLPLAIIVAGVGLAVIIVVTGPRIQQQPPPSNAPLVRTWTAISQTVQMTTITHGTVLPRTESELIPEVSGRVTDMSPAMVSGGFFSKGDVLISIETLDYEVALEQASAAFASAQSELTNARKNHARRQDLAKKQSISKSQQDDALNRLHLATASLQAARAGLRQAERNLARTKITAPYDGRVRSERVDIGQFVNRGASVATLYATDYAEVRLPIHDEELAFLQLPLSNGDGAAFDMPPAILRAQFGGQQHAWEGKVVRTEGELDPQTRMINVIVQVKAPYQSREGQPPLAVGLFVEAELLGHEVANVFVVPRSAIQTNNQVYVIDDNNQLVFRDAGIVRIVNEDVYITSGFVSGETLCLSTIENAIEGMTVQPAN